MEELIAKRYAQAFTAATKDVAADAALLNALSEAMDSDEVRTALTSPVVTAEMKTEMVLSALGNNASTAVVNFIKILGENKRLDLVPTIAKVLNKELQKESNQYNGVVKSAKTLDDAALADLEETLQKYTGALLLLRLAAAQGVV